MNSVLYPTSDLNSDDRLLIERGEGIYVFDAEGKRYLEGMSGLWCTSLGYGNGEICDVARQQMSKLSYAHMFGGI